jgi:hypothetical protein
MTLDAILFPIGLKAYYQIPTFALKNQMPRKKGQKLIPTKREGIFSTFFTNYPISWALNSPSPWPIHSSSSVLPAKAIASSPTGLLHPHPFCLIQKLHFQLATRSSRGQWVSSGWLVAFALLLADCLMSKFIPFPLSSLFGQPKLRKLRARTPISSKTMEFPVLPKCPNGWLKPPANMVSKWGANEIKFLP